MPSAFYNFAVYDVPEQRKFYTGCNQKNILIVCKRKQDDDPSLEDELLTKIMKAVDVSLSDDVHLLSLDSKEEDVRISSLIYTSHYEKIITFGLDPIQLGILFQVPYYKVAKVNEHDYLISESLSVLLKESTKKGMLWSALQVLFKIKK